MAALICTPCFGSCPPAPVNVNVVTPPPEITMKTSSGAALAGKGRGFGYIEGWSVNGLAASTPKFQVKLSGIGRTGCFRPTFIEVEIGFLGPIEVVISDRYPPGSCEYEVIRTHEFAHVDIMKTSVSRYRQEMATVIANTVALIPEFTFTLPDAQQRVLNHVQHSARAVFDRMMSVSHSMNAALDTPENYRREQAACVNW